MQLLNVPAIVFENTSLESKYLDRKVIIDFYLPTNVPEPDTMDLLLINDGQNMEELGFAKILAGLYAETAIRPLFCVAIHASANRRMEYGVAGHPDYLGRGAKAQDYTSFILLELLPYIRQTYAIHSFKGKAFAGFSLGGLTALDIGWNHPDEFNKIGVFSGSLWWRMLDQNDATYNDDLHRIMHQVVRAGTYHPGQRFFFQSGNMDETNDRNNNGIIDSIDDTLDMIAELERKGYERGKDIQFLELPDGRHDIPTWAKAMPEFLKWGWGI
ncbi:MAG TPA: alpha/beta hydrolase-fold protein [Chitinophagaceae bacterium]|nr:alpha/beta hydrolase-fold protein [Chitinophagaceae bacterium]